MKWNLLVNRTVNIDKSNVMIFNKNGGIIDKYRFTYDNLVIKITNAYIYLEIIFVPSGSFSNAISRLKETTSKAYFKIRDNLLSDSGKCSLKLFYKLIQSILNYGCKVWAPYLLILNLSPRFLQVTLNCKLT